MTYKTDFSTALTEGNLKTVQSLLKQEPILQFIKINSGNIKGLTPLLCAAKNGHSHIVKWLLENDMACIREVDALGRSALIYAAYNGHMSIMKYLLSKGAQITEQGEMGFTVLHFAVFGGSLPTVQWLVLKMQVSCTQIDHQGVTAFMHAVCHNKSSIVKWFLDNGKANLNERDSNENTALHLAAASGDLAMVQLLIKGGYKVSEENSTGVTALIQAAYSGYLPIVQWLLRSGGAKITEKGGTCIGIRHGEVKPPLEQSFQTSEKPSVPKLTALLHATRRGHHSVVQWLLTEGGAKITEKNEKGRTAIDEAIAIGNLPLVQFLLSEKNKAIAENKANNSDFRFLPLHTAAFYNQTHIIEWLLSEAQAKPMEIDADDKTALHWAAEQNNVSAAQLLHQSETDLNAQNSKNNTALHLSAERGNLQMVQWLIEAKAEVTLANIHDENPLGMAILTRNQQAEPTLSQAKTILFLKRHFQEQKLPIPEIEDDNTDFDNQYIELEKQFLELTYSCFRMMTFDVNISEIIMSFIELSHSREERLELYWPSFFKPQTNRQLENLPEANPDLNPKPQ